MIVRFLAVSAISVSGFCSIAAADDLRTAASKVADCRNIAENSQRLACLDAAALELSLALDAPAKVVAPSVPVAPVAEAPKAPEWAKAPEPRKKPEKQVAEAVLAEDEAVPEKEKNVPIWARVFRSPDKEKEEDVYQVTITRITRNNLGRHFFHTSEGQVWRQTAIDVVKPPKSLPAEAKISRRVMGNPALKFVNGPRGEYIVRREE